MDKAWEFPPGKDGTCSLAFKQPRNPFPCGYQIKCVMQATSENGNEGCALHVVHPHQEDMTFFPLPPEN